MSSELHQKLPASRTENTLVYSQKRLFGALFCGIEDNISRED